VFLSLAFLDLTVLLPATAPVLEPAAAVALLGAVACAAAHVKTSPATPRRPGAVPDDEPGRGAAGDHPVVIPRPRRGDVPARPGR
jgi:hypothetical protein